MNRKSLATPAPGQDTAGPPDERPSRSPWSEYLAAAGPLLDAMGEQVQGLITELDEVRRGGATVFLAGNGGSASAASHLAQDLLKGTYTEGGPPLRAVALTDNLSMLTAYANDCGYERVFAEPLRLLARPGDRLLVISCSGTSPNVVAAARWAGEAGLRVLAVTAGTGGTLRELADLEVNAPTKDVGMAEAMHSVIFHFVTQSLRDGPSRSTRR
ncbi:SIS domain-containing protein [Streptomyces olivoreticuli]|uniref:SIS domain-containing protein n=1 Tax=Streptomyces blastmyceticus TaxID=68180 RepID=A0ABN0XKY7_9ACTN|nr:SIS domain-containing protein [Streptomyces olivoreticuli]WKK24900.1 SIS domain-containing protein [Streptomyces olivoreticuli]